MKIFYRLSDNSYHKGKLPGTSKKLCLANFLEVFAPIVFTEDVMAGKQKPVMTLICDNCEESMSVASETGLPILKTSFGNAKSLQYALSLAVSNNDKDELIYFVEDDYLHHPSAYKVLMEGQHLGDYITLYDHPDKYTSFYNFGETSKVLKTKSSHWRYTQSTCMTFLTKPKILIEDWNIWEKYTSESHPNDYQIFVDLEKKGRKLIQPIPGMACHTDLAVSGLVSEVLIDGWAIELATAYLAKEIHGHESLLANKSGWEKLTLSAAIAAQLNKAGTSNI